MRIAIIEDNHVAAVMARAALEAQGHEVLTYPDYETFAQGELVTDSSPRGKRWGGCDGWYMVTTHPEYKREPAVDLVVTDMMLPHSTDRTGKTHGAEYPHGLACWQLAKAVGVPVVIVTDAYHHDPGPMQFACDVTRAAGEEMYDQVKKTDPDFWRAFAANVKHALTVKRSRDLADHIRAYRAKQP